MLRTRLLGLKAFFGRDTPCIKYSTRRVLGRKRPLFFTSTKSLSVTTFGENLEINSNYFEKISDFLPTYIYRVWFQTFHRDTGPFPPVRSLFMFYNHSSHSPPTPRVLCQAHPGQEMNIPVFPAPGKTMVWFKPQSG
jgi:hypothetical protein